MARLIGTCKLCLTEDELVNSHIIPRSFYEEYKGKPLIAFSEKSDRTSTIRKGVFGKFLCDTCEKKFCELDDSAFNLIKSAKHTTSLAEDEIGRELLVIENANLNKNTIHKFALSILWRAKNSIRQEYPSIKLGYYEDKIRSAIFTSQFNKSLLDATGIMLWEFRGSKLPELDASGYTYRCINKKTNLNFTQTYGNFRAHIFGYPYGEILIRLGGERPKQDYFKMIDGVNKHSVLWSCNLTENYPNLVVCKTPRARQDGSFVGTDFQKEIFNKVVEMRLSNNEETKMGNIRSSAR